jgi:hypothetical protein
VDVDRLEASLVAGHVWVAHGDAPNDGEKKVGITAALRRLPTGVFQVNVDTYYIEGIYGTDISWDVHRFDTLAAALQFIEEGTGISRESLEKYKRST